MVGPKEFLKDLAGKEIPQKEVKTKIGPENTIIEGIEGKEL